MAEISIALSKEVYARLLKEKKADEAAENEGKKDDEGSEGEKKGG